MSKYRLTDHSVCVKPVLRARNQASVSATVTPTCTTNAMIRQPLFFLSINTIGTQFYLRGHFCTSPRYITDQGWRKHPCVVSIQCGSFTIPVTEEKQVPGSWSVVTLTSTSTNKGTGVQGSPPDGSSYGESAKSWEAPTGWWQGIRNSPLAPWWLEGQKGGGGVTRAQRPGLPSRSWGCRERSCPEGPGITEEMKSPLSDIT